VALFKLTDAAHGSDVREIRIEGELDLAVADQLTDALDRAAGARVVLIDLSGCEFIDSTGTSVIVRAYVAMKNEGRRLALVAPAGQIRRSLEMIGLMQDNLVFESAETAVTAAHRDEGLG
jgi:anti-sigma B factor antagonist